MNEDQNNPVITLASKFGKHLTDFSKAIGVSHPTVASWAVNGRIPQWRHQNIIDSGRKLGIEINEGDFN